MTEMDGKPLMRPVSHDSAYDAASKTLSQIEVDIAATRAELGETIGTLERKLAPRQLLESGVDTLRDAISQNLRSQPLPLALVGLGIGWLLMSQGTRLRPSRAAHDADQSTDYASAREKSGAVMERAQVALDGAGSALNRPRGHAMDAGPLALGVLGLLAGAAAALMLPRSKTEERLIGPAGERLREETASLGREVGERAQHIAERTVDAAADTVRQAINGAGRV
jgi:Protein of unknown function (DUF3618)